MFWDFQNVPRHFKTFQLLWSRLKLGKSCWESLRLDHYSTVKTELQKSLLLNLDKYWLFLLTKRLIKSLIKKQPFFVFSLGTNGSGSRISPQESMRSNYISHHSKTGSLPGNAKKQWRDVSQKYVWRHKNTSDVTMNVIVTKGP